MFKFGRCALIAPLLAIAAPAGAEAPAFHPRADTRPFSDAVQVGDVLYLSGKIGEREDGQGLVPGGLEPEARRIMELTRQSLAARGLGLEALFKCTVMLADMSDWPAFNAIYASYFKPGRYPARSALGANGLALGARVELECLAWNPREKETHARRQ